MLVVGGVVEAARDPREERVHVRFVRRVPQVRELRGGQLLRQLLAALDQSVFFFFFGRTSSRARRDERAHFLVRRREQFRRRERQRLGPSGIVERDDSIRDAQQSQSCLVEALVARRVPHSEFRNVEGFDAHRRKRFQPRRPVHERFNRLRFPRPGSARHHDRLRFCFDEHRFLLRRRFSPQRTRSQSVDVRRDLAPQRLRRVRRHRLQGRAPAFRFQGRAPPFPEPRSGVLEARAPGGPRVLFVVLVVFGVSLLC
mmetsp:Transcript_9759/g.29574  ORF Transcript_9759/g.29574 Transcript_9759/m.29574 type:complete len:256 (+) Transcript_9759:326-1093(+)